MIKFASFIIFFLILHIFSYGQIRGKITDTGGNPLPYTAVYLKNTTKGTSSNNSGDFELNLDPGTSIIVFHLLGYQVQEHLIEYKGTPLVLNIQLIPSIYSLKEIIVHSNQEDPAYEIIRNTISKRKYYLNLKRNYEVKAYTKGVIKILDAPDKILGQEIGTMDNNLDSNKKGIVYLSETQSLVIFEKPDKVYEEMISSIISGKDNGFSFNRATSLNFNLYENVSDFGKGVISPIADYALDYYNYKLLGIDTSSDNRSISYKILARPKITSFAAWTGILVIGDSTWNLQSLDLFISGKQFQQELFDTVHLTQLYIPVVENGINELQNQLFRFKANLLGIKMEGRFIVVFSDYKLDDHLKIADPKIVLKIKDGANEKRPAFWDSIRPIPLTAEEKIDYIFKDSIKLIRDSEHYKDSVDRRDNRWKLVNLLIGYSYNNSYDRWRISLGSPIELFHFNPVQGWTLGSVLRFSKFLKPDSDHRKWKLEAKLDYGFSERKFRSSYLMRQELSDLKKSFWQLEAGVKLAEYNNLEGFKIFEESSSLITKKSFVKYYNKKFISLNYGMNLSYDLNWQTSLEYTSRNQVENHSNFSLRKKSIEFQPNNLADYLDDSLYIFNKLHLVWENSFNWNPGTKVELSPAGVNLISSEYPTFYFDYNLGIYPKSNQYYHRLELATSDYFRLSKWGELSVFVKLAKLFHRHSLDSPDLIYQHGNGLLIYNKPNTLDQFLALYPYAYVIDKLAVSSFFEYDMQGFILDRIPIINKLGLKELFRYAMVATPDYKPYSEFSFGFGNIGYKVFRILRIDLAFKFYGSNYGGAFLKFGVLSNIGKGK